MRILQVGYAQARRFGQIHVSNEHKLWNGLIKNGHNILHYSDRDMAAFLAPFRLRDLGKGKANKMLIRTALNFRPDLMLLGHCDIIKNETLAAIRKELPELRIAYRNVDPLFIERNVAAIQHRAEIADSIFITTAGEGLDTFRGKRASIHFMPNPCDPAVDTFDNSVVDELPVDLFFCGNSQEQTDRRRLVEHVHETLDGTNINFKTPGFFGQNTVWGVDYEHLLQRSKMGLNLNRQEGHFLYSSDRLAQLIANGILAFIHRSSGLNQLIGDDTAAFFDTQEELVEKIRHYKANDADRKSTSRAGRQFYREHFSCESVAEYIVHRTMQLPEAENHIWSQY